MSYTIIITYVLFDVLTFKLLSIYNVYYTYMYTHIYINTEFGQSAKFNCSYNDVIFVKTIIRYGQNNFINFYTSHRLYK